MATGLNAMTSAGASDGFNAPDAAGDCRRELRFCTTSSGGDSAQKWAEKSGDFYTSFPLKNVAKSTY
jgi:hypothetical protein